MDPTTNPTPTPNPVPTPGAAPAAPGAAGAVNPAAASAPGTTPAPTPATAAGGITTPQVNPIIQPGGGAAAVPGVPGVAAAPEAPVAPATPDTTPGGLAATDPIMMPEPAPAPDPVEEELKAPMKAAAPAPGSIGSAVSGPAAENKDPEAAPATNPFANDEKQTPSVAFNDPATQPDPATGEAAGADPAAPAKKKTNKTTLIALIAVAGVIVVVLVIILIMQIVSGNSQPSSSVSDTPAEPVVIEDENDNGNSGGSATEEITAVLNCSRDMTTEELADYAGATSGTIEIAADFGADDMMTAISLVKNVVYGGEDASADPVAEATSKTTFDTIDAENASDYYLTASSDGTVDGTLVGVQQNYKTANFICEL